MGHGELVPAPVAPQTVHGVEHVQQRQVSVQRQAVPGGRADLGKRDVGLHHVHVLHLAVVAAHKGAHQARSAALAAQMLEQRQQRAFARIQRHEVEVVEHARLCQLAQLGVDKAAAQHGGNLREATLDGLGNAERRIGRARKGHGQQNHRGLVTLHGLQRQALQHLVHQIGLCRKGIGQRIESGLAAGQRLGIAHELEALVHGIAQHIGQIVEVKRGQMLGLVVQSQGPESPAQRIAAFLVLIHIERGKARAFGQKVAPHDAVGQRGVSPLQKSNRGRNRGQIALLLCDKGLHGRRVLPGRQAPDALGHGAQAIWREQLQHQGQGQVFLRGGDAARAQKAGQIGRGGVGSVELRHRRNDGQHAGGQSGHGVRVAGMRR